MVMYFRQTFLEWLAAVPLLCAGWLLMDGAAGLIGWRGLRSTRLRAPVALVLAALSVALFAAIAGATRVSPLGASLAVVLGLPLHLLVATFMQRSLTPEAWVSAGLWERHRATTVELPVGGELMPALYFEPLQPNIGALVLIHGAGAHKTFYTWPMIESMLENGFAVCAIDLAGHGESRRILDVASALEDVEAAATWLRERSAWVGAIGISLGGCVAARAAADGLRLEALAIFEAPATLNVTRRVLRHERLTLARTATWSLHRYAGTLPLIRAWATRPTHSRISTIDLIHGLDLPGSLARIDCPLWLCYGASDAVVPLSEAYRVAAATPAGTPLAIIPGATHLSLPIDRRALRAFASWLQQVRQSEASLQPPALR